MKLSLERCSDTPFIATKPFLHPVLKGFLYSKNLNVRIFFMNAYRQTPIFKKSQEIFDTLTIITDLIPDDNRYLQDIKDHIMENILVIQAKLAGAHGVDLWDIRMENAAIIRKCARELTVLYHSLRAFGFEEADYYKIVRVQLEEFRLLFRDWVASFDPKKFIVDDWGLFNPPGIPQDYVQRSDELNFLDEEDGEGFGFNPDDFEDFGSGDGDTPPEDGI
jgi:hypothetical protein